MKISELPALLRPTLAGALAGALLGAHLLAAAAGTSAASQGSPAAAVLQRVLGAQAAARFSFAPAPACNGACLQVSAAGGHVAVQASSPVDQAYAAASYLRQAGALDSSWEGGRVAVPARLPDAHWSSSSPFALRAYLNVCAFGYSTVWWDWARWEKEIDWMALHGVNLPTAMEGQEYVWRALWREFGLSDAELADYFAGPAFLPWQRMGNIGAHRGPLPASWIDSRQQLQGKILKRMRELGMQPVTPAFGGYVPKALLAHYPQARIHQVKSWNEGFEGQYWLDPRDPLFSKIATRFIQLYRATYGDSRYHLADAFNEITPPVGKDSKLADLASFGDIINRSLHEADPDGIWVMQSWLFGHDKEFWSKDAVAAFFSKVPDRGVLVEDIGNDRYALWKALDAFQGKPWIYGFIHNYGGTDAVFGDFDAYRRLVDEVQRDPAHGKLAGFGVFPEGIENNSVVYDYLFDLPWQGRVGPWQDWIAPYLKSRYGADSATQRAAWQLLHDGVYNTIYWQPRWWRRIAGTYMLSKRPGTVLGEEEDVPGDRTRLRAALELMLRERARFGAEPLFRQDALELGRHYLSMATDRHLRSAIRAYQAGRDAEGAAEWAEADRLLQGIDALLGAQNLRSLADNVARAAAQAPDPQLAQLYSSNAKAIVTTWGGVRLKDYASRSWQGLYADFYRLRWQRYFQAWQAARASGRPLDDAALQGQLRDWEEDWVAHYQPAPRHAPADPLAALQTLLGTVAP